jgi:hypothetical protein
MNEDERKSRIASYRRMAAFHEADGFHQAAAFLIERAEELEAQAPEPEPEHKAPVERHAPEHVTTDPATPKRRPGRPARKDVA